MSRIQFIKHADIDQQKWNGCVTQSSNGLIYAYASYLDAMTAGQWDALVLNDYEAVMPLTWNRKYGIYYLYQPFFCASLGVFSKQSMTKELLSNFLHALPQRFKYVDIYLNQQNLFTIDGFPFTERINYVLKLDESYESISNKYRTNLKRNIKKAEESKLIVRDDIAIRDILSLAKETMQRVSPITDEQVARFEHVFSFAKQQTSAETIGIYSQRNELLASAAFLHSHNRWYYILVGNHPNGKTLGASHYLIDRFIHKHASTNDLLDFEGSDIRNLAFFYSSYGAVEEKYPALRMNRLPKLLRWLKD
ncbi:MAG: GNAT family N-acetyltransferase [Lacibacter sp.]